MTIFDATSGRRRVIEGGGGGGRGTLGLIGLAIAALVVVILLFNSVTRVGTGRVGVLTLFGKVTGETLPEGMHLINPLKTNNQLSIQTQSIKESATTPSSEGLMMNLDTSLIYHLNPDRAAEVFQKIGPDYENLVVEPTLRAAIREATSSHTANALYTGNAKSSPSRYMISSPRSSTSAAYWSRVFCCATFSCRQRSKPPSKPNSKPSRSRWP